MNRILPFLLSLTFVSVVASCGRQIEVKWDRPVAEVKKCQPELAVYIENSGSMNGYLCNGSEFKDAVYDYVSALGSYSGHTRLNYINSQVVPFGGDLKNFIWNITPASFSKVSGSHANSQLSDMLDKIIAGMNRNSVAVFVSDCILDVPQGDASQFFRITQTDIKNSVLKRLARDPDFAVQIIQLNSKFVGNYYGTNGVTKLNGEVRPYYIWVLGDKANIAYLNSQVKLGKIQHGYAHCVAYSSPSEISYDIFNQYSKTDSRQSNAGRRLKVSKGRDGWTLQVKANLYPTLLDDKSIANLSTYHSINSDVKVEKAETIDDDKYPHLLTLHVAPNVSSSGEMITLSNAVLPQWVIDANDDTGLNIKKNIAKTSGIKYIIGGVCDAYSNFKTKAAIRFTISK